MIENYNVEQHSGFGRKATVVRELKAGANLETNNNRETIQ
jgi:hypothetical protein